MKLEHALAALHDATVVQVLVEMGQQVSAQQVLVEFAATHTPATQMQAT